MTTEAMPNTRIDRRQKRSLISWAFYDWAHSAFSTVIQTFVFAAYFTQSVAANQAVGTLLWGLAIGAAGLIIAVGGPLLGAAADNDGRRKPWIATFTLLCAAATALLWFVRPAESYVIPALILVAIGTVGSEFSFIFYNTMLPQLAPSHQLGRWSGWGWALGYAGGLTCLAVALVLFINPDTVWHGANRAAGEHIRFTFLLVAAWYLFFSMPLFLFTEEPPRTGKPFFKAVSAGIHQLIDTMRCIRSYGTIIRFLIARMLYVDGLVTLFAFGGVYAAGTFGMSAQQVLMFGIGLNVTAGIGAALSTLLDDRIGSQPTIIGALIGLIIAVALILLTTSTLWFWIFGLVIGIFVGPIQASSRTYLARTAPEHLRTQMFGLYALAGKATSFLGPLTVGFLTYTTGSQRLGVSAVLVFLGAGLAIMMTLPKPDVMNLSRKKLG